MPEKTKKNKKDIKVRDLKPKKDAKGGGSLHYLGAQTGQHQSSSTGSYQSSSTGVRN